MTQSSFSRGCTYLRLQTAVFSLEFIACPWPIIIHVSLQKSIHLNATHHLSVKVIVPATQNRRFFTWVVLAARPLPY